MMLFMAIKRIETHLLTIQNLAVKFGAIQTTPQERYVDYNIKY